MESAIVIPGGNLSPVTVNKEWGHETLFGVTHNIALKQITVRPTEALSRQVHIQKDEIYLVIEGRGCLELGPEGEIIHDLRTGDSVHIPPGVVHRLRAGDEGVVVIEASTPELNDIVRLDDRYGRPINAKFDVTGYQQVLRV